MAATISVQVGATVESVEIPTALAVEMHQALAVRLPLLPDETLAAHTKRAITKWLLGNVYRYRRGVSAAVAVKPPELGIEETEDV